MSFPTIRRQIEHTNPDLYEKVCAITETRAPRVHRDQVERFLKDLGDLGMLERAVRKLGCDEEMRSAREKEIKIMEEELAFAKKKEDKDKLHTELEQKRKQYFMLLFNVLNDENEIPPLVKKIFKDVKKGKEKLEKGEREKKATMALLNQWGLSWKDFKDKLESLLDELCIENCLKPKDYNEDVEIEWDGKTVSLNTTPVRGVFFVDNERKTIYAYQFDVNGTVISVGSDSIYYVINNIHNVNSVELSKLHKLLFDENSSLIEEEPTFENNAQDA
jgi:hypothetical protein